MSHTNPRLPCLPDRQAAGKQGLRIAATALLALVLLVSCSTHSEFAVARSETQYADASFVHYATNVADKKYYAPAKLNYAAMYNGALAEMAKYLKDHECVFVPRTIPAGTSESDCQRIFNEEFAKARVCFPEIVADDPNELAFAATAGLLDAVQSSHTGFMQPKLYEEYLAQQSGAAAYAGIGVRIGKARPPEGAAGDDCWYVAHIFAGGPADRAGLKELDEIVSVDGVPLADLGKDWVERVRGAAGTKVALGIRRRGAPLTVTVTREAITLPTVESHMVSAGGRALCYIRYYGFSAQSEAALMSVLRGLNRGGRNAADGIILDLRSNGGGSVATLDNVLNALLPRGKLTFVEVRRSGESSHYTTSTAGAYADIPLVVLVNENSASAAEISSSALQIAMRAKIVGVKTSGAVEAALTFPLGYSSGMQVTVAQVLDANRMDLEKVGVTPDVVVVISKDDVIAGRDSQLDAAVKELLAGIK